MKTNPLDLILKLLLLGAAIAIAVSYYSMKEELSSMRFELITKQISQEQKYQHKLDSLFTLKANTVTIREKKIIERERERDSSENQINNTDSISALIPLYYKHRSGVSN